MATSMKDRLFVYLASASVIFPAILLVLSGVNGFMDGFIEGVNVLGGIGSAT